MRKYLIIALILIQPIQIVAEEKVDPLTQAKKIAIGTNKLILVYFYADWCGPCKSMQIESWSKQDIKEATSNYVFVKIDTDQYRNIAEDYEIQGIPYIFVLDPNGEVVFKNTGYLSRMELLDIFKKYAINLKYLQTSYLINYKNETIGSLIRLATKLQEFSIILENSIKKDFLLLSRNYLSKAEKMLKKNKSSFYSQKIALLYLQGALIIGDYEKVNRKLNKSLKHEDIEETNKALYYFLNYMVCDYNQQVKLANQWLLELKKQKGNDIFLKEIELLAIKD